MTLPQKSKGHATNGQFIPWNEEDDRSKYVYDLDNPIHPLFKLSNWFCLSPDIHSFLTPALQLCSLFVTDRRILDWFYHDMVGIETPTRTSSRPYLAPNPEYEGGCDPQKRQKLHDLWTEKLDILSIITSFDFHNIDTNAQVVSFFIFSEEKPETGITILHPRAQEPLIAGNGFTYGRDVASTKLRWEGQDLDLFAAIPKIDLNQKYLEYPRRCVAENRTFITDDQKYEYFAYQFMMALIIGHELAHVCEFLRYGQNRTGTAFQSLQEAKQIWFNTKTTQGVRFNGRPEAGYSWERYMFGGPIICQYTMRAFSGVRFGEFDKMPVGHLNFVLPITDSEFKKYYVPTEFIMRWFCKWHWAPENTSAMIRRPIRKARLIVEAPSGSHSTAAPEKNGDSTATTEKNDGDVKDTVPEQDEEEDLEPVRLYFVD